MQLKGGGCGGGGDCPLAQEWAPGMHSHTSIDTSAHCRLLLCTLQYIDCIQPKGGGGGGGGCDCLLAQEWAPGMHLHTSIDTSAYCRPLLQFLMHDSHA